MANIKIELGSLEWCDDPVRLINEIAQVFSRRGKSFHVLRGNMNGNLESLLIRFSHKKFDGDGIEAEVNAIIVANRIRG